LFSLYLFAPLLDFIVFFAQLFILVLAMAVCHNSPGFRCHVLWVSWVDTRPLSLSTSKLKLIILKLISCLHTSLSWIPLLKKLAHRSFSNPPRILETVLDSYLLRISNHCSPCHADSELQSVFSSLPLLLLVAMIKLFTIWSREESPRMSFTAFCTTLNPFLYPETSQDPHITSGCAVTLL
jgi:hypothetical protein